MTPRPRPEPHDSASLVCGAQTRGGSSCQRPAGWGTDHVGQGKCKLHGGATPVKHGRYSTIRRPRIRDLIETHAADKNPLDTHPELAAARALFQDFIERYDEYTEALIAWHESYRAGVVPLSPEKVQALRATLDEFEELVQGGDGLSDTQADALRLARECVDRLESGSEVSGKPHQVLDISDAYRIVSEITKIVERIEKTRAANAVSLPELERLFFEMKRAVQAHVEDPEVVRRIEAAWLALRV